MKKMSIILLSLLVFSSLAAKSRSTIIAFHLDYVSKGSMWPYILRFTIDRYGNCVYRLKNKRTGVSRGFTARIPRSELAEFKSILLNKYKFFSLPNYPARGPRIKDANTSYLTVRVSDKIRRLGGYAVGSLNQFRPVFRYIRIMISKIEMKYSDGR